MIIITIIIIITILIINSMVHSITTNISIIIMFNIIIIIINAFFARLCVCGLSVFCVSVARSLTATPWLLTKGLAA